MNTFFDKVHVHEWLKEYEAGLKIQYPSYRIYSINRPGRLLNVWTLLVGAYSRLGAYSNKYGT